MSQGTYMQTWSVRAPGCYILLIDQSAGMSNVFDGHSVAVGQRVVDVIAKIANRAILELAKLSTVGPETRPRVDVGVIGYGAQVRSLLPDAFVGKDLVSIADLSKTPLRIEKRERRMMEATGELVSYEVDVPVWIERSAYGETPMCSAIARAATIARRWAQDRPTSFPPVIVNITDG